MTNNRLFNHCLIYSFILIVGLGLALVVPLLASSQGLAAKSSHSTQVEAPASTTPIHVAKTGDGTDGLSWTKAFTNVQDALAVAVNPSEIWVAKGVYYPDVGSGQTNDDEFSTFVMTDGVAIYGGFAATETLKTERDWGKNITVLSGDIDGNDTNSDGVVMTTTNIAGDNAYHVVTANNVDITAVLDGFTITAGQADANFGLYIYGGGFYCYGSGIGNECSPNLKNITFIGNYAWQSGGAMCNLSWNEASSNPTLMNVSFYSNTSIDGGAMANFSSGNCTTNPSLTNVVFSGNSASNGGAMFNYANGGTTNPELMNVIFSGNSANSHGGAIYSQVEGGNINPTLSNISFSGNSATSNGGAMYNEVYCGPGGCNGACSPELRNSILWNNKDKSGIGTKNANIYNSTASVTLKYSLAQGTGGSSSWTSDGNFIDGGGNIDTNPWFIKPVNPSLAPTTSGNLRLQSGSPAINTGKNAFVTEPNDLDGNERIMGGIVDMGAYEALPIINLPLIIR